MPRQRQQHANAAHLAQQTLHRCATHIPQLRLCRDAAAAWGCTMSLHVYPAPVHMLQPHPPRTEDPDMGWTSSMHVCCDTSTGHTGGVSPPPHPHPHTHGRGVPPPSPPPTRNSSCDRSNPSATMPCCLSQPLHCTAPRFHTKHFHPPNTAMHTLAACMCAAIGLSLIHI